MKAILNSYNNNDIHNDINYESSKIWFLII